MIISGALHYFRVHPPQWQDRIRTLRHMGVDTIETYVPWNLHEPAPGDFTFDGFADLGAFLDEVSSAGLSAIVRPGPYIGAEWENGGLPAWLTAQRGIRVRTSDPAYLDAVDRWFDVLIPVIVDRQATAAGPVTMVQVENEYGSFGSDTAYLEHLRDGLRARGVDVPLFTSDGSIDLCLVGGTVDGAAGTVNFGTRADEAFAQLAKHRPDDEPFCMEFWNGWFDHWGSSAHGSRDADDAAAELGRMLTLSVPAAGADLEVIIESMGRINYGPLLGEQKGLAGGVQHHTQFVHDWTVEAIPFSLMPELPAVPWASGSQTPGRVRAGVAAASRSRPWATPSCRSMAGPRATSG